MPDIPPPPPLPVEPVPEPAPKKSEHPKGWYGKLKKWGGIASVVAGLAGFGGTVWKTIAYIDELHDTIGANKAEVQSLRQQIDEDHDELAGQIGTIATAVRAQRDRDQEVITQLRIAVAALQAAQDVRAGRATYGGVQNDRIALARPVRPPTASARRAQAAQAEEDAAAALTRARRAQATSDEDPLAALEGL